uniref:Ig-like domain-containing protein n=1 Tax=Monodelphis domestica TaxID=13616 RepID=A0A5F8GZ98_MONDO
KHSGLVCHFLLQLILKMKKLRQTRLSDLPKVTQLVTVRSAPSHKWSMQVPSDVTGEAGGGVVLLCTFTHPHKYYDGMITVIWRIREPFNGSQVFRCVVHSNSDHCQTTVSYKGKYKLLGNPRHNNISIRLDNLTWMDDNRYFCRVEFAGDIHDRYESRSGIRLHVIAAPRIINITVLPGPDHIFSARCTAEGEPLPSLTWTGPSAGNSTSVYSQSHQITKELHALAQDGRYTCTATNSLGHAEGSVYFYKFRAAGDSSVLLTLLFALGIKLLLLLVILGAFACQSKGGCFFKVFSNPRIQQERIKLRQQ